MYISDIVLLKELTSQQQNDFNLIAGCVGGAELRDEYIAIMEAAGFTVNILNEDANISKEFPIESLNFEAVKC